MCCYGVRPYLYTKPPTPTTPLHTCAATRVPKSRVLAQAFPFAGVAARSTSSSIAIAALGLEPPLLLAMDVEAMDVEAMDVGTDGAEPGPGPGLSDSDLGSSPNLMCCLAAMLYPQRGSTCHGHTPQKATRRLTVRPLHVLWILASICLNWASIGTTEPSITSI